MLFIDIKVTVPWSLCDFRVLCSNGRRYRHDLFCIRHPHVSPRSC